MNRRLPIIVLLIVALIATGFSRQLAASHRNTNRLLGAEDIGGGGNSPQLSRMNSFALALLLGGLRGPLVMILWSSSESQKAEKDLEDFDTKVEWIRLLQPEFDTVHIFQIWNKAYNISVQMASLANKYLTIIDAIDYGRRVDAERPDNINIIYAIGSVYGDKLGESQEKVYYTRRVKEESKPHPSRQKHAKSDAGYRPLELDPVLDEQGRVLSQYLKPRPGVNLVDPANPADVYDGSELPFLKKFEPYPYGVDPHAFAYNYRKRAQLLQRLGNERHAQLADTVVDSRPATDLRVWGQAEWDHGRRCELRALGRAIPTERLAMEQDTTEIPAHISFNDAAVAQVKEAIYSYHLAEAVWKESDAEYVDHLRRYVSNFQNDQSQRDEMAARSALLKGDEEFLSMLIAAPADRAAHIAAAHQGYDRARARLGLLILRYYINPEAATNTFPPGQTPPELVSNWFAHADEVKSSNVIELVGTSLRYMREAQHLQISDEVQEILTYIQRADAREKQLPAS